ncbi:MAG: HYR domain-containing protein, partial [Christiangramia sp.]|nr:HYR domain-containing protein [Christiangramia sp.]
MKQNYLPRFLIFICLYLIGASSYSQNSYTFTAAGAAGRFGPTQEQVNSAYTGTPLEGKVVINTQGIQEWIVPVTGNYSLNAVGASGGYARNFDVAPGLGAAMYGEFTLTAGQVLKIAVGQKGGNGPGAGSGGGGTFIVLQDNSPLIIAGGGGGQQFNGPVQPYQHGSTSTSGQNTAYVNGGQNGLGGEGDTYNGAAGGGGLLGNGNLGVYGTNGLSFLNGAIGGDSYDFYPEAAGGFGGGGGTHGNSGGGGGGGGYSGGAGGRHDAIGGNGGGGGSFNSGLNQLNTTGVNAGDGAVTITLLCSPLIITQSSTDVQCPGTSVTLTATSENGGNVTWDNGVENGVPFDITETTTFTASSDNYLDCSQSVTVTVEDTEDPVVQTQNITVQLDSMGNATITPEMIDNGSTDSCGIANMSLNISSFDCSNIGANTVILTVEDNSGNTSSAEATVTVQDNLAPVITCQSNIEVDNDSGISGAVVTWTDPVAMDNCLTTIPGQGLNILFTREHIAGNGDLLEVPNELSSDGHNVTIAINDNWSALTGDLSDYDLIVWDATMLYNYSLTQSDYDNLESWVQEGGNLLVTGYDVVFTPEIVAFLGGASGADFGGNNNLTVLGPGNSLTTGVYDIVDTTIFGVNDWDALNGPYSLGVVDIVGAGRWTLRTISGGGQIAWMTSSYLPDGIWNTPGTGYYEALKNFAFNTSSSGVNVSQIAGLPSGSEFPVGTTTNTFEAIDAYGNKSTCSFDVTVNDVEAPAGYSVSIDQTEIDETNETSVSFTFANAEVGTTYNYTLSSDNGGSEVTGSGTITTANDQITGIDVSGLNDGTLTLSVTLTDTSSNEGVAATDTIFKETNAAPVAVCKAFIAQLSANGSITITPADVDGGSSDDKTGFSLAIDKDTFDCSNLGDNQVELTVTDSDGITATCTATVTVEDNVAPVVTTVGTLTVQLDENG